MDNLIILTQSMLLISAMVGTLGIIITSILKLVIYFNN